MKDEKKAPKLRFKGFTDDWKQCKLGDVADITTGSRNHQDSVTDGKYPFFVRSDKVERLNEYDFDTRAILVPGDGRIGEIFHYYNGKFALHQRVYKVDNFDGINALFLLGKFKYSFKKHALRLNAQGTVPSLRLPMFTNWNISIPNITEQERIGSFFRKLDRTITLHEEKERQLERLKSALLQKMFADQGGYPPVRFEGFSDEWKIFKLSSLATMHARIGWQNLRTSEFLSHGKYMLITGTDFNNGQIDFSTCHYVEKERYEQDKHIQIKNGSILITKDGTLGKVAYVQGLSKPATLNAGIFNIEIRNENEIDRTYLFQYLKAPYLMNYVQERATGGTIKHLNQSILKSFPVQIPNKIEQNKIGELITKLDHLINLQRKKLNNIAALKNSLLQSMFI